MKKSTPERLLEALQVIEGLRRSLQDIGRYTMIHGEEKGQKALWDYIGPHLYRRLTHAREQVDGLSVAHIVMKCIWGGGLVTVLLLGLPLPWLAAPETLKRVQHRVA